MSQYLPIVIDLLGERRGVIVLIHCVFVLFFLFLTLKLAEYLNINFPLRVHTVRTDYSLVLLLIQVML